MKLLKKFFFSFALICAAFFLCGCQDIIFANIRKEVKLNDGTVSGTIRALIRYTDKSGTEYIYLANGKAVYRKLNPSNVNEHREGGWQKVCPGGSGGLGKYVVTLAADATNLYALAADWDENTSKGQNRWYKRAIYASSDGGFDWKKVHDITTSPTGTGTDNVAVYLFCTNTIVKGNRQAYFNVGGAGYKLNGSAEPTAEALANNAASCAFVSGSKPEFASASGTYYGSASCTDENRNSVGTTTTWYWSDGSTLFYSVKDDETKRHVSVGSRIYSLAVTKDYILVGTDSGIKHFTLNSDGSVGGEVRDFATNADAIMSSGYEVNTLLVIDPSKSETETAIYSAIDFEGRSQQFDHVCIWAYYPWRKNWNRD
ncbi:MAG: hypothetical protein K2I95_11565 [Treponemataceae bacterium]|nr:hypothetical protein [Treponemataceae bacterium]